MIIRLIIYHPIAPDHVMAVVGNHKALGGWCEPQPMALGAERLLLNGERGRCWEFSFTLPDADPPTDLFYCYVIVAQKHPTAIWEREPHRNLHLPKALNTADGVVEIFDANFVAGMQFDAIPPALFIGPYPQSPEDVELMKASGVTAVLNVQTDGDLRLRRIDWDRFVDYYRKAGIECHRLPIIDFNEEDLIARLPAAVDLLKRLVDAGHRVYVHCTAGMGRSPAVVVAYLSRYHGQELLEALEYVRYHRSVVCPNLNAIRRVLAAPLP